MSKIVYLGYNEFYAQKITNDLTIPKPFVENCQIRRALYATIDGFSAEEQKTILLRYWIGFSIKEIAELTKNPPIQIVYVLILYLEKLKLKLIAFNPATKDVVSIEKLFEVELWKQYEVYLWESEKNPEYRAQVEQAKKTFFKR